MRFAWMLALVLGSSNLDAASVFAATSAPAPNVATMTCDQADEFMSNDSYNCDINGTDCSRGECVDMASCRYIKGVEGFTLTFSYPTTCGFVLE